MLIWLLLGGLAGAVNLVWQGETVQRLRPDLPRSNMAWLVAGVGLRWLLVIGLFIAALRQGLIPALLVLAGLWLARSAGLAWLEIRNRAIE